VHTPAQIQTQRHWLGIDRGQPGRGARQEVERHDIAIAQRALNHILGLELNFSVVKTHLDRFFIRHHVFNRDTRFFQSRHRAITHAVVHFHRGAATGDLDGGAFTKKIGQGIESRRDQRDDNQDVFPKRITIHDINRKK